MASQFSKDLLEWYKVHARTMPWRVPPLDYENGRRADPYRVWLSEIMLQQTQVVTVKAYFQKFTELWPNIHDLAAADLEDVLKAWAGLGYYSRARNLKKCADQIVLDHNGRFPESYDKLKKLPGIGDYTAAAIASIAFGQAVPVVDGNVERVFARTHRITETFPKAKAKVRSLVEASLDTEIPGEFAQATMDLGATICTPRNPVCRLCPVNAVCEGFAHGDQNTYPLKEPKKKKPTRVGAAYVLLNQADEVFLCKRPDKGLLAGMTQVPTTDWTASQDGAVGTVNAPVKGDWKLMGNAKHTFTHFHLELEVWVIQIKGDTDMNGWWCAFRDIKNEALPKVMHKVLTVADSQRVAK
ncbi:MAG: A/G-specific adenine glycosylase [Rhizobiaceae bacterium]|nr:A/G-specific adenine glycosylase [Rhizobiaceae bacterium]